MKRFWLSVGVSFSVLLLGVLSVPGFSLAIYCNNASPVGSGCSFSGSRVTATLNGGSPSAGSGTVLAGAVNQLIGPSFSSGAADAYVRVYLDGQQIIATKWTTGNMNIGDMFGDNCGTNCNLSYTAWVKNNNSVPAWGYWKKNGTVQYSALVSALGSLSYTYSYCQGDTLTFGIDASTIQWLPDGNGGFYPTNVAGDLPGSGSGITNAPTGGTNVWDGNFPPGFWDHFESPWSWWSTNGPIHFTNMPVVAANDNTLKAGFNATVKTLQNMYDQDGRALAMLGAIERNTRTNVGGGGSVNVTNNISITNNANFNVTNINNNSISNLVSVTVTNDNGGLTNAGIWSTNFVADDQKTWAEGIANDHFGTVLDGIGPTEPAAVGDGTAPDFEITVGNGGKSFTMDLSPSASFASFFLACKTFIEWFCIVGLFVANWRHFEKHMMSVFTVPQATTAGETVLGSNINAASAIAVAVVIIALIATIPTFVVSQISTSAAHLEIMPDGASTAMSPIFAQGWYLLNQIFPTAVAFTAIISHMIFRIAIMKLYIVAAAIIKLLVGV
jgi:hypothetical protein